jgi:ABC-type glutathione transport system ATPase component
MKVLSGVYPHGTYTGDIEFDGQVCEFADIRQSEQRGIVIIHQELALSPYLSIAENIFLGNERSRRGVIDWNETNAAAASLLDRVGLHENPVTRVMDIGVGKQQLVEFRSPSRPAAGPARGGHHLHHHFSQAERDQGDRRFHHHHPGRQIHRNPGYVNRCH